MHRSGLVAGLALLALLTPGAAVALEPYETVLVSRQNAADGGQPNDDGYIIHTEVSGDGRHVAFSAESGNLTPGQPILGHLGVYLRDLAAERTTLISSLASTPTLSHDGRYLAYQASTEGGGPGQVYVRDNQTGTTTLVSRANGPDGVPADANSFDGSISGDGRYVLFRSGAKNLPGGGRQKVYLRDLRAGRTIAIGPRDRRDHDIWEVRLSANGRWAVITETEQYDDCCSEAYRFRIFRYDVRTRKGRVIFKLGRDGLDRATVPAVSGDGRYVAFSHEGYGLSIYDAKTRRRRLLSRRPTVRRGSSPDVSADGRYVTFHSMGGRDFERPYQWIYDRRRDRLHLASRATGRSGKGGEGYGGSITADGRTVAFDSDWDGFVSGLSSDDEQVFARRVLP